MQGAGRTSPPGRRDGCGPAGFPSLDDGHGERQPEQPERPQDHQPGGWNPGAGHSNPTGLLGTSVSLPNLGLPVGAGGKGTARRGQGCRGRKGKCTQKNPDLRHASATQPRQRFSAQYRFICSISAPKNNGEAMSDMYLTRVHTFKPTCVSYEAQPIRLESCTSLRHTCPR